MFNNYSSLEQINSLQISDCLQLLVSRLDLEAPTQAELEAELEVYKSELIAEIERVADLKSRFSALSDHGLIQAQGISNPAKHFIDHILNAEPEAAEQELAKIEQAYAQRVAAINADSWLRSRQVEYAKIDSMLLEGLAEDAAGRPERLQEYLALREKIKLQYPKPE